MTPAMYSRTLFDLLREQAHHHPHRTAVIDAQARIDYAQLAHQARRVAAGLQAAGVGRGDRVGLWLNNRVEWIETCFGAAAIGAVVVPLSTWSKRSELDFLLGDARIKLLVSMTRFGERDYAQDLAALLPELEHASFGTLRSERYPALRGVVVVGEGELAGALPYVDFVSRDDFELVPPGDGAQPADDALVLYTSGSTAYPKAVRLAHAPMIENGFNIGERQGLVPGDPVLLPLPLFWSYGSANAMCATFTHAGTLVLQGRFEPGEALNLIERHGCVSIYTLPAVTAALLSHPGFDPARTRSLRTGLTIGGAQDLAAAAERLGAHEICNVYGQTESYGNCCVTWHHWPLARRQAVQGPPLPGARLRVVDETTGAPCDSGQVGLIEVGGRITAGYDGRSREQNDSAFTADGFFRTGDLGRITQQGDIEFVGRSSEIIKRAGINVSPAEVEDLLMRHPAVSLAGVTGVPDAQKGELVVAFVVPTPGMDVSEDALRAHCSALASSYKIPDRIETCAQLPSTPTGKLLRRDLRRMAEELVAHAAIDNAGR